MKSELDPQDRARLRRIYFVLLLAIVCYVPPAFSQGQVRLEDAPPATPAFSLDEGGWHCVSSRGQLLDLSFTGTGVRVNNITLTQTSDFMSRQPVIRLSASVVNPTMARAAVSLESFGITYSEDGAAYPVFAINAREQWGSVQPGSSQEISSTTYARADSDAATQFCVRPFISLVRE
jgi:hypothetical protein|tara:strand:+ start:7071 stop:7601 length:531 start_codon:yes stop_codon:yes gene_type:complete